MSLGKLNILDFVEQCICALIFNDNHVVWVVGRGGLGLLVCIPGLLGPSDCLYFGLNLICNPNPAIGFLITSDL